MDRPASPSPKRKSSPPWLMPCWCWRLNLSRPTIEGRGGRGRKPEALCRRVGRRGVVDEALVVAEAPSADARPDQNARTVWYTPTTAPPTTTTRGCKGRRRGYDIGRKAAQKHAESRGPLGRRFPWTGKLGIIFHPQFLIRLADDADDDSSVA